MLAALLTAHHAPLTLAHVEPAGELTYGQVLVRVLTAGICGAQLQEIRGEKGGPLPHLLGHEGCGLVEAIGPGVTRVAVGDKVVMHWRKAAGIESPFPTYQWEGRRFTSGLVTTWAERTVCSENRLTPVPADTDPQTACLLGCSVSTALATVESEARWGERVLVIGAGGLGLALLGALEMVEPTHLACCDLQEEKRLPVECLGAEFHSAAAPAELATALSSGPTYDLILDTAGAPETTEAALPRLAPDGRYVLIGQPPPGRPICVRDARHLFSGGDGKTLRATQGGGFRPDRDIPRYLHLAESVMFAGMVTHLFPLAKINAALDLARTGQAGRILLEITPAPAAAAAA